MSLSRGTTMEKKGRGKTPKGRATRKEPAQFKNPL